MLLGHIHYVVYDTATGGLLAGEGERGRRGVGPCGAVARRRRAAARPRGPSMAPGSPARPRRRGAFLAGLAATLGTAGAAPAAVDCPRGVPRRGRPVELAYAVLFRDELETLHAIFSELGEAVDRFVVAGSDHTFGGEPKPDYLQTEFMRYEPWAHKFRGVQLTLPGYCAKETALCLEHLRSTVANEALQGLGSGALVVVADADEVLSTRAALQLKHCEVRSPIVFGLRRYAYTLNWELPIRRPAPPRRACSASQLVAVTDRDLQEAAGKLGSAGAVRGRAWREGLGANATCLHEGGPGR